jgi:hypothetical protein
MNRSHIRLILALLASALVFAAGLSWAQTRGQTQNPPQKKAIEQKKEEPPEEYTEEEYDAYEKAVKEPDLAKRGPALIAFMEKYPKSKLQEYIVAAYKALMFEYSKSGDYAKLEPAAEQWLKYAPNDLQTIGFVATAAIELGHDKKFTDYGEKIFAQQPGPQLAMALYQSYQKTGDEAKKWDWALKLLEYPEYNDKFDLRWQFVLKYAEKDIAKAAEYSQLTLKSLALAKKPEKTPQSDWDKAVALIQRQSYNIIGMNYFGQKKYPETVQTLGKALAVECYDAAYYYIGMSQWQQASVEDAEMSFAKAELLKGEYQARAKTNLEKLYRETHNGNLTGIEKKYKTAQAELAEACGKKAR